MCWIRVGSQFNVGVFIKRRECVHSSGEEGHGKVEQGQESHYSKPKCQRSQEVGRGDELSSTG